MFRSGSLFILKGDKTPTSIGGELQQFSLGGSPISSKIKPPADCRGAQMYYVMQSMTHTSQQVRRGVLEFDGSRLVLGVNKMADNKMRTPM